MLAIARTPTGNPDLLLLDEPSEGLAPKIVKEVMNIILGLKEKDISILLVEQNSVMALAVSGRSYILDDGRVVYEGPAKELNAEQTIEKRIAGNIVDISLRLFFRQNVIGFGFPERFIYAA